MKLEIGLLEAGIALAILIGSCIATWFAADAHYSKTLSNLQGQLDGAAQTQQRVVAEQIAKDGQAAKAVDDEAKSQIGSMSAVIADLSVRNAHPSGTGRLCAAGQGPQVPDRQSARPAAPGGSNSPAGPPAASTPAPAVSAPGIDLGALGDALELGSQSIKAELLWREWARKTGHAE